MGKVITVKCPKCSGPMIRGNTTCSNCISVNLTSAGLFGELHPKQVSKNLKTGESKQKSKTVKQFDEEKDVAVFNFFNKKNAFYSEAVVVNSLSEVCDIDISKIQGTGPDECKWGLPYSIKIIMPKKWHLSEDDLKRLSDWRSQRYLRWILTEGSYLLNDIQELKGKRLGDNTIPYPKKFKASVAAQQPDALGVTSHGHILIDILKNKIKI